MQDQNSLDFVDVDVLTDTPVFIDPRAIRVQNGAIHALCVELLVSFFTEVIDCISQHDKISALELLGYLDEPNETHLGVSKGRPRGKGLGGFGANKVVDSLFDSRAAQTGILQDLEDSALFIPGIGRDIISDITTNVVRKALIQYTQQQCHEHSIPMAHQYVGWVWEENELVWSQKHTDVPDIDGEVLLLVPKSIVRTEMTLKPDRYYRAAIAPLHEKLEIDSGSSLVYALKNGERRVRRDELIGKYGNSKRAVIQHTNEYPEALTDFKKDPDKASTPPMGHKELARKTDSREADYNDLLERVGSVSPGGAGANLYHRAVADFLAAIFYPHLGNKKIEKEINEGRKRIDIAFDNLADDGFFRFISRHYMASQVVVECKNYTTDPSNPEIDQVSGRFSRDRTQLGVIVCRKIQDKELFALRCRDVKKDGRGIILFLDDDDLQQLLLESHEKTGAYQLLRDQYDYLVE